MVPSGPGGRPNFFAPMPRHPRSLPTPVRRRRRPLVRPMPSCSPAPLPLAKRHPRAGPAPEPARRLHPSWRHAAHGRADASRRRATSSGGHAARRSDCPGPSRTIDFAPWIGYPRRTPHAPTTLALALSLPRCPRLLSPRTTNRPPMPSSRPSCPVAPPPVRKLSRCRHSALLRRRLPHHWRCWPS